MLPASIVRPTLALATTKAGIGIGGDVTWRLRPLGGAGARQKIFEVGVYESSHGLALDVNLPRAVTIAPLLVGAARRQTVL